MTEEHVFQVEIAFFSADDGRNFEPWCSCGWEGRRCFSVNEAQEQWDNHCEQAFIDAAERTARTSP